MHWDLQISNSWIFLFVTVHVTTGVMLVLVLAGTFATVPATYGKFANGQQSSEVISSFKSQSLCSQFWWHLVIYTHQGHSHQVWSGQVCSAWVNMLQLGSLGAPSEKFGNLEATRLLLRHIFGPIWCWPDDRIAHAWLSGRCIIHNTSFGFLIVR